MALLVANNCSETFVCTTTSANSSSSKAPPPKKKWIQAYMEKATENNTATAMTTAAPSAADVFCTTGESDDLSVDEGQLLPSEVIGGVVQGVIDQFQDYIDVTNQRNHSIISSNNTNSCGLVYLRTETTTAAEQSRHMARLLYPSHNSRKFTEGLQRLAWDSPPYSVTPVAGTVIVPPVAYTRNSISAHRRQDELLVSTTTEEEKEEFSKEDIGGVVQNVISQFLNGSLSDHSSFFRSSRRRSSSRHKRRHRSGGGNSSSRSKEDGAEDGPSAAKIARITPDTEGRLEADGVLNLSLPKPAPKVTFALEDKCYAEDGTAQLFLSSSGSTTAAELVATSPPAGSGGVSGNYSQRPAVARPGVIAAPPAARYQQQQRQQLSPTALASSSSCVHFAGGPSPSSAVNYLTKSFPVSAGFSSVIKPLPALVLTSASTGLSPTSLSSSSTENGTSTTNVKAVLPSSVKSAKNSAKTAAAAASRRQVIVKSPAAEKAKSTAAAAAVTDALDGDSVVSGAASGSNNREMHNRLEKNRRAHLKACFDELATECELDVRKTSNLTVIKSALKYIMLLRRKEREHEKELADLVQEKIRRQQLLSQLTEELPTATAIMSTAVRLSDDD